MSKKINELIENLPENKQIAIEIYKSLVTQAEEELVFEKITYKDAYKVKEKLKPSRSCGETELTNLFLRNSTVHGICSHTPLQLHHSVGEIPRGIQSVENHTSEEEEQRPRSVGVILPC